MQPFLEKYAKQWLIPCVLLVGCVLYFLFFQPSQSASIEQISPFTSEPQQSPLTQPEVSTPENNVSTPIIQSFIIDVKGAVTYPGVYTLSEGERIIDAIEAAGGYTEHANPALINHAQKLQDEMVIYIPKLGEEINESIGQLIQTHQPSSNGATASIKSPGKVNLNQATESELTTLPGIGPSKATAIIQHRTEIGYFQTIEDLKNVSGIGAKTYEQLKDLIDIN
ncbi:transporter [Solibacillus sp. R5-41]|uniref:helix-hairpin-helix domain-containing protein n=1 Tax=Solibacillus sp. R5-41 TaxID=2048654 RepID=UPI000C125ADC|nr:helix-hairpin-helix domain-containing protein [Solibacillus sp. R5-41]ATP41209.1 transporter [Solibacillus sp. R5-41]